MPDDLKNWIEGSAFVDDTGPVTWHHATDCMEPFNLFTRWDEYSVGFHFGTTGGASARAESAAMEEHRVIAVHCRARAPLRLRDHQGWSIRNVLSELSDLGVIREEIVDAIYEGGDEYLFAALELAGHDCVVYRNETEGDEDSMFLWRSELVKSVDSELFLLYDPGLRSQDSIDAEDLWSHESLAEGIEKAKTELSAILSSIPAP